MSDPVKRFAGVSRANPVNGTVNSSLTVNLPDAGTFAVNNDDGLEVVGVIDGGASADTVRFYHGVAAAGNDVVLKAFSTAETVIGLDSGGNSQYFQGRLVNTRKIAIYENINTVGTGTPPIYGGGTTQHKTNAAPTSVTYTPPSAAGAYVLTVGATIKTATSLALKLKLTYTGADGAAKSDTPGWLISTGGTVNGGTGITTAVDASMSWLFNVDNSGGVITLADNSGTYTTCEYWLTPIIQEYV